MDAMTDAQRIEEKHLRDLARLKRSVFLDVLATDREKRKYNLEIQRDDLGANFPRARFHCSAVDTNLLEKGLRFEHLPETYVIFITERDVIGRGQAVYRVDRYFDTGEPFPDGSHIVYVNGAYRDDSPIGKLMHDLACPDPNKMHYDVLAERVRFFKENEKGVSAMCKVFEELRQEGIQEGMQKGMQKGIQKGMQKGMQKGIQEGMQRGEERRSIQLVHDMLAAGKYALEEIAALSGLPISEIKRLQAAQETI